MMDRFSKYKQQFIFVLVVEVIAVFLTYALLQDNLVLIFAFLFSLNNALIGWLVFRVIGQLEENAVNVSEILGQETKHAFLFGLVGLLMYDENHKICWQSDLFNELNLDLVGLSLGEWQKDLEDHFDSEDILTIQVGEQQYEVYNNQDTRTLYLKDVTNFNELLQNYHDEQLVFGYLSVDNFDETISSVDEQKGAIIQSTVRSTLVEWANEFGIILRRYRQENYLLICNEAVYQKLAQSKFVILNRIREQAAQFNVVLGLSIGLSRHVPDLHLMDDIANDAFSLALSRGGDQVVVKTTDEPVRYFGGNSETRAKTSRVRVRIISQSLGGLFRQASAVFIMGHAESDLDSLGASIALMRIVKNYKVPVYVVVNPDSMEAKTKRAYRLLVKTGDYDDIFVIPQRVNELVLPGSLLVSVDNHRKSLSLAPALVDLVDDVIVIDHHRRGEEFMEDPILTYLEPAASSTVELITEFYDYQDTKVRLSELEATIMYAGMLVDTSNFKSRVGVRTFKVAATLKDMGADMVKATELLQDDFAFTLRKAEFIQSAQRYNNSILVACGQEDREYSRVMLAKVGNDLLAIDETEAAFVIGRIGENTVAVSSRSTGKINVQMIMEKMGGGGHFTMAACQLQNKNVEEVRKMLIEKLDEYYQEREES